MCTGRLASRRSGSEAAKPSGRNSRIRVVASLAYDIHHRPRHRPRLSMGIGERRVTVPTLAYTHRAPTARTAVPGRRDVASYGIRPVTNDIARDHYYGFFSCDATRVHVRYALECDGEFESEEPLAGEPRPGAATRRTASSS